MQRSAKIFACFVAMCAGCVDPHAMANGTQSNIVASAVGLKCQEDPPTTRALTDYAQPGPYQVGVIDLTFEDKKRPILANAKHPAASARALGTSIYYPARNPAPLFGAAEVAQTGPFPLLVHSHGYGSSRAEATQLGRRAASHGYIVVAVDFPFTSTDRLLSGEEIDTSDIIHQAGDVSFLIDQMLALSHDPKHLFANAVDEERIGVTGVSLGGLTTLLVTYHPQLKDARIKAAAPIAPLSSFFMHDFYHTRELPLLIMSGDLDAFIDYDTNARRSFERAAPHAQLVTFKHGTHAAFAFQLDAASLALMNSLLAAPDAHPANADGFGCAVTGQTLSTDHDYMAPLGGLESFIDYDPVNEPIVMCQGDEYKQPGLDALEQVELAAQSVIAFFDGHLGKTPEARANGCRYLLQELAKHPVVSVE